MMDMTREEIAQATGIEDPTIVNVIKQDFASFMEYHGDAVNQCTLIGWVNFWTPTYRLSLIFRCGSLSMNSEV